MHMNELFCVLFLISYHHHLDNFVAVWLVDNVVGRINEVNQRRARLVLEWVTVGWRANHLQ